jgi:hypothetical protein
MRRTEENEREREREREKAEGIRQREVSARVHRV